MKRTATLQAPMWPFTGSLELGDYGRGVAYALAAAIALGTLGPVSNLAYAAGMGSATLAALRATVGALVLVAAIRTARHATVPFGVLTARDRRLLGVTAVAQALLSLAIFAAYDAMPVATVLAVYFCYPLLVAGASIALGRERLTPIRGLGLVAASGGLILVLLGGAAGGVEISLGGILLAGAAAVCQACYLVISRTGYSRLPSDQASAVILAGAATLIWLVAIPLDGVPIGAPWATDPTAWLAIVVGGVLGAAFAKVFVLRAVRRVGGTRTSVLMLAEPLVGVALAAMLLGQGLTGWQALGGIGVLVGAVLAQRPAPGASRRAVRPRRARPSTS